MDLLGKSLLLAWVAAQGLACGGATVGGAPDLVPAQGGTTSTTGAPVCFGQPGAAPTIPVTKITTIDTFVGGTGECLFSWSLGGYAMNPNWVFFYFMGVDGTRMNIPYVGTLDGCKGATTYGGWYATSLTDSSIKIGLCNCTCNAAHKYAFRFDVATEGIKL